MQLPPSLQLTLSWGDSIVWTKQVELPCDLAIREIGAELRGDRNVCELRGASQVIPIRAERRTELASGALLLVVDAISEDIAPAIPAGLDPRFAMSDLGSLMLHAVVGLLLFLLADPLAESRHDALESLVVAFPKDTADVGFAVATERQLDEAPGGLRSRDERPPGASGPGASLIAARGSYQQPSAGGPALARSELSARDGTAEAESSPMIALIARGAAGSTDPGTGADPWSGAGLEHGPSWGDPGGIGDDSGIGALSLSGIGEGGGSRAEGINLGPGGVGTCGDTCTGTAAGRLSGSHRVSVRMGRINVCGTLFQDGVAVGKAPGCSANVQGRLPAEAIQRIVRQNFGRFRLCYENDLRNQPSLSGRVTVAFTIARDGSVRSASAGAEGVPTSTASCISKAMAGLSFPEPDGGVVNVVYPLALSTF